ncbi:MAG: hypothetical protein U0I09_07845 [Bacteroidaceae bacterium]|nr:hypothetical protein [Bacteroidaceae bacterium]MEE1213341.1 hypothetical protein [Bacteroidaceae bacterium]
MAGFWLLSEQMCRYGMMTPLEEHGYTAFFKGCHYFCIQVMSGFAG